MRRLRQLLGYTVFFTLFGLMALSMVTALVLPHETKPQGLYAFDRASVLIIQDTDDIQQEGKQKILMEKNTLYTHVIDFGYEVIQEPLTEPKTHIAVDLMADIFYPPKFLSA